MQCVYYVTQYLDYTVNQSTKQIFSKDIQPMLGQCWHTVYDAGPTFFKNWANASCFLESIRPQTQVRHRRVPQIESIKYFYPFQTEGRRNGKVCFFLKLSEKQTNRVKTKMICSGFITSFWCVLYLVHPLVN